MADPKKNLIRSLVSIFEKSFHGNVGRNGLGNASTKNGLNYIGHNLLNVFWKKQSAY